MSDVLIDNIQVMLKYQYFKDTNQKLSLSDIVYQEVRISYADVMIWFSNKDQAEHLDIIKKIWDATPQHQNKSSLDAFLKRYAEEVCDKFRKYRQLIDQLKQIQLIIDRTKSLKVREYELLDKQSKTSVEMFFEVTCIEEFNFINFQSDSNEHVYQLCISYGGTETKLKGVIEPFAMRIKFNGSFSRLIPYDIGTLQVELRRDDQVIGQRNLDPFTSLDETLFPLKTDQGYLTLQMKISTKENIINLLENRLDYVNQQYQKSFKICHLYKANLRLLIQPFDIIRFDDNGIYLQKINQVQKPQGCTPCSIF